MLSSREDSELSLGSAEDGYLPPRHRGTEGVDPNDAPRCARCIKLDRGNVFSEDLVSVRSVTPWLTLALAALIVALPRQVHGAAATRASLLQIENV